MKRESLKGGDITMKIRTTILALAVAIVVPVCAYSADFGDMYLRYLEGDVMIKTEDTTDWVPAAMNMPLREGDRVWVPEGARAELQLRNGSCVRLDKNSSMEILALDQEVFQFFLDTGHAYLNVVDPIDAKGYVVAPETPTGSFRAYRRTAFRVDVAEGGDSEVSVLKGEVYVELQQGQVDVKAGDRLVLRHGAEYPQLTKLYLPDSWEQWNRQRDGAFGDPRQTSSAQYLPDDLSTYSAELDSNGNWVSTPDYGYVWAPTVVVAADWAPYRNGRWVWMGGDYVWISYEPWGWVPYHYGRWTYIGSRGWCWVPPRRGSVYWGPGYVGWVYTSNHVSWVPLAPGETYYGHRNYGPGSANITEINMKKIVVKDGYRNARAGNGITTMHRNSFVGGRQEHVKIKENLFLGEHRPMGAPWIRPEKGALMPAIKAVSLNKLPPRQTGKIDVKTIRKERTPFGTVLGGQKQKNLTERTGSIQSPVQKVTKERATDARPTRPGTNRTSSIPNVERSKPILGGSTQVAREPNASRGLKNFARSEGNATKGVKEGPSRKIAAVTTSVDTKVIRNREAATISTGRPAKAESGVSKIRKIAVRTQSEVGSEPAKKVSSRPQGGVESTTRNSPPQSTIPAPRAEKLRAEGQGGRDSYSAAPVNPHR